MFKVFVSQSDDVDTEDAIDEVLEDIKEQLNDLKPKAGLLYCGIDFDHQLILDEIYKEWPNLHLIGATTDGEFGSHSGFLEDSISFTLFVSDKIEIASGLGLNFNEDVYAPGNAVEGATKKLKQEPALCITNPEAINANGDGVLALLKETLGNKFPIYGGLSADQWRFNKTYQFYNNQVLSNSIPILLFAGALNYSSSAKVGWSPIGDPAIINRSKDNIVFEIDNMTAKEFYTKKIGDIVPSGDIPLAILDENGKHKYLRASIMNFEEDGSLAFLGNVPQGSLVQLCHAQSESLLRGCDDSIKSAIENYPKESQPEVALCFSCAGRHQILGTRTKEETDVIKSHFEEKNISFSGFYTYGEIGSNNTDTETHFHNETFITLLIGEA